jgi:hypothetical protein
MLTRCWAGIPHPRAKFFVRVQALDAGKFSRNVRLRFINCHHCSVLKCGMGRPAFSDCGYAVPYSPRLPDPGVGGLELLALLTYKVFSAVCYKIEKFLFEPVKAHTIPA